MTRVLAVDVGGTKLAAGLLDERGTVVLAERMPTPAGATAEQLWSALTGLLDRVAEAGVPDAVGVGCGGPMRWPAGEVSPLNIPGWREFPLRAQLAEHFGVPVRLHNDGICLAAAEHWQGAARGYDDALGMVVSTGVGGGLILGGRVHDGATGNSGHIGHVVVDPSGPPCPCGGRGCLEAIARGPALVAWARGQGWTDPDPSGSSLATAARAGHPVAVAAWQRAGSALGIALASTVALLDLGVVCLGGGMSAATDLLLEPLSRSYAEHAGVDYARTPRVRPAALGDRAGLLGAAALVLAGDRYWSAG